MPQWKLELKLWRHIQELGKAIFEGRNSLEQWNRAALPLLSSECRFAGWVWTFQENLTPQCGVGGRSHPHQPGLEALCCSCCSPALPETSFPWSCSSRFGFRMNHCSWKPKNAPFILFFSIDDCFPPSKHSCPPKLQHSCLWESYCSLGGTWQLGEGGTLPAPGSRVCSTRINPPTHTLLLQIKTALFFCPLSSPLLPAGSHSLQHIMVKVSTSEIPGWVFTHSPSCLCGCFSAHQGF